MLLAALLQQGTTAAVDHGKPGSSLQRDGPVVGRQEIGRGERQRGWIGRGEGHDTTVGQTQRKELTSKLEDDPSLIGSDGKSEVPWQLDLLTSELRELGLQRSGGQERLGALPLRGDQGAAQARFIRCAASGSSRRRARARWPARTRAGARD